MPLCREKRNSYSVAFLRQQNNGTVADRKSKSNTQRANSKELWEGTCTCSSVTPSQFIFRPRRLSQSMPSPLLLSTLCLLSARGLAASNALPSSLVKEWDLSVACLPVLTRVTVVPQAPCPPTGSALHNTLFTHTHTLKHTKSRRETHVSVSVKHHLSVVLTHA